MTLFQMASASHHTASYCEEELENKEKSKEGTWIHHFFFITVNYSLRIGLRLSIWFIAATDEQVRCSTRSDQALRPNLSNIIYEMTLDESSTAKLSARFVPQESFILNIYVWSACWMREGADVAVRKKKRRQKPVACGEILIITATGSNGRKSLWDIIII